jgi:hypothetical protein
MGTVGVDHRRADSGKATDVPAADGSTTTARPIVLWAVPRSRSTAFERIFVERDDVAVLHEPFSAVYYRGPQRRSDEFLEGEPDPDATADQVLAEVLRPRERRVFVKDMAYHVTAFMDTDLVGRFTNTFLVRDPREALTSLHAKHPTFTFEEAGYEQLARLYDLAVEQADEPVVVVDADDLMRDADGTVRRFCGAVDLPFVADALRWEAQEVDQFSTWDGWHDGAQQSTGLGEVGSDRDGTELPPELAEVYERCLPYYEHLLAARRPSPT